MARCARAAAACRRDGMLRGKRPAWLCVRRRSLRRFAVGLLLLWCTVAVAVLDLLMTLYTQGRNWAVHPTRATWGVDLSRALGPPCTSLLQDVIEPLESASVPLVLSQTHGWPSMATRWRLPPR